MTGKGSKKPKTPTPDEDHASPVSRPQDLRQVSSLSLRVLSAALSGLPLFVFGSLVFPFGVRAISATFQPSMLFIFPYLLFCARFFPLNLLVGFDLLRLVYPR